MTPTWLLDVVAAIMLVVAAVSAARLVVARPWRPDSVIIDTDIAHLLMAIAMAGTLAPGLRTFPSAGWEVIFGALIVAFGVRVLQDARANGLRALAGGHCAPHLVHSGSMLYMFLALGPVAGMAGMSGMAGLSGSMQMLRYPTLAFAFTLVLVGYTIWDLDQLSGKRYSLTSARVPLTVTRAAAIPAMAGGAPGAAAFSGLQAEAAADLGAVPITGAAAGQARVGVGVGVGERAGGVGVRAVGGPAGQFLLSPAVTVGARIVMGIAMAFMLLTAI